MYVDEHYQESIATEWKKIYTNHIADKGSNVQNISRTLTTKQLKDNPIKKLRKDMLPKKMQMANMYMKIFSASLIIRKSRSKPQCDIISYPLGSLLPRTKLESSQVLMSIWRNRNPLVRM